MEVCPSSSVLRFFLWCSDVFIIKTFTSLICLIPRYVYSFKFGPKWQGWSWKQSGFLGVNIRLPHDFMISCVQVNLPVEFYSVILLTCCVIYAQRHMLRNLHFSKSPIATPLMRWSPVSISTGKTCQIQSHPPTAVFCLLLSSLRGVPAVVDFAAMRDAVKKLGGNPEKINPVCPADLVIDHSIQVDFNRRWGGLGRFPRFSSSCKILEYIL